MKTDERVFLEALERGIELFNEARFMEAYEVWEDQWTQDASDGTDLLQGLLQLAVGLAKLQGGNPQGTKKLLEQGIKQLEPYRPEAYDIDIDALVQIAQEYGSRAQELIETGENRGNTIQRAPAPNGAKSDPIEKKRGWWTRIFKGGR